MRGTLGTFLLATAAMAGAATVSPARADVTAGEVLSWCDGASQPGQLGTINALRCVNYLQGAAEMIQALSGTDFAACLQGGQSVGTQLMARFVPVLRTQAASGSTEPVARQVADWLQAECAVEFSVVAEAPQAPGTPTVESLEQDLLATMLALEEAQRAAEANAEEAASLRAELALADPVLDGDLAACTASLDKLQADLAAAEAAASENGIRVAELELELEAVDAEAMARRQEIAAATDRIDTLSDQFDAALDAKRREIEDAEARIAALTEELDGALSQRALAELALSEARREASRLAAEQSIATTDADGASARLSAAENRLAAAEEQIATLEDALETSRGYGHQLEEELRAALESGVEHTALISALEGDLAACEVAPMQAAAPSVPPPAMTPTRESPPPSAVAAAVPPAPQAPAPTFNRVDVPNRPGANITNGNARVPGSGATIAIASQPQSLDTLGLLALRRTQQIALNQNAVGQRRQWASADGDYTGYVEVLREGYAGPDFCREIYSVATNGGAEVHRSPEMYCRVGDLWVYRR